MNINEPPDPRSSMWAWMAFMLRFQRQTAGVFRRHGGQTAQLCPLLNFQTGKRRGQTQSQPGGQLDEAWKTGGLFGVIRFYATLGHDPNWFKTFTTYEARATSIRVYEALVIPGLLQTPAYARALLVAGQVVEDVERALDIRMARQRALTKPKPVRLWALVKESVLEDPVGDLEIMREQLGHLMEMSRRPNIVVRVVPRSVGAHIGLDGSFSIMTTPTGNAAYMEAVGGGRLSVDAAEIDRFQVRFDQIGADALSRDSTRSLIAHKMETMQ